jgi:hypothetical protein
VLPLATSSASAGASRHQRAGPKKKWYHRMAGRQKRRCQLGSRTSRAEENEKARPTVVVSYNLAVDVREPEDHRERGDDGSGSDDGSGDGRLGQRGQIERGRSLVDDGHRADGGD